MPGTKTDWQTDRRSRLNFDFDLTTVQLIKLPLQHEISEIAMICSAQPALREDLHTEHKSFQ
jgi:hypothetical protein